MREVAATLSGQYHHPTSIVDQDLPAHHRLFAIWALVAIGMKLSKAYTFLADVQEHKQVVPFTRFNGGVGRASQAKQFGRTQGASSSPPIISLPS